MTKFKTLIFALAASATATVAYAAEPVKQHNSNALWFANWIGVYNATLIVSDPSGKTVTLFEKKQTPVFKLSGEVKDGVYRYELSAATDKTVKLDTKLDNGRGENQKDSSPVPYYAQGHFIVERGVIVPDEKLPREDG